MKKLRCLILGCVLTLCLSGAALAGDIGACGFTPSPPPPADPASAPIAATTEQPSVETNLLTGAIAALQFVISGF